MALTELRALESPTVSCGFGASSPWLLSPYAAPPRRQTMSPGASRNVKYRPLLGSGTPYQLWCAHRTWTEMPSHVPYKNLDVSGPHVISQVGVWTGEAHTRCMRARSRSPLKRSYSRSDRASAGSGLAAPARLTAAERRFQVEA